MAILGTYRNGPRFRSSSLSDEDEALDDMADEPRDEVVRRLKLRSKVVKASYSDDDEGHGDDVSRRPAETFSRGGNGAESYSRDRQSYNDSLREGDWQAGETRTGRQIDVPRTSSFYGTGGGAEGKAKRSSEEAFGGRLAGESLDRVREQHRGRTDWGERSGREGTVLTRDSVAVASLSPSRRNYLREKDYGNRRDVDASVGREGFVDRKAHGLSKGKGKRDSSRSPSGMRGSQVQQRERDRDSWHNAGSRDFQDHRSVEDRSNRSHFVDKNTRRDRYDSLSPPDSRGPGERPRTFSDSRQDREKGTLLDNKRNEKKRSTVRHQADDREDLHVSSLPELYSVYKGIVHSIRAFGVFVRINGFRNHGLVHLSQVSDHEVTNRNDTDAAKVEALSSIVSEGEQVWVKVISIKTEDDGGVKIGCSLKYVSQGDGKDLDPNNLQLEKLQSRPVWQAPRKLELDAVYNVVCSRCGGHGHLKTECYSTGAQSYALLTDEDIEENGARSFKAAAPKSPRVAAPSRAPAGPMGRGRAMVQPAWMKHGVGLGGDQERTTRDHRTVAIVPDRSETLMLGQGSGAASGKSKEHRRGRRGEKKDRSRHHKKGNRTDSKDNHKDKHRKRHRSDAED